MDDLNGVDPDKSNSPKDESTKGESALAVVSTPVEESERANRCGCLNLGGDKAVKGCNINGIARSAINMSNIYLANSMIFLACEAGGGLNEAGTQCVNYGVRVYGNKPDTLITNISVAAGLVAAILMPFFGAMVDYTAHRKRVGIWSAAGLAIISGIQVGTNENTWFAMAILQAVIFVIYELQLLVVFAYYPEIGQDHGEKKTGSYMSTFSAYQFASQFFVNAMIIIFSYFGRDNGWFTQGGQIQTAMFSQGVTAFYCVVFLSWCWWLMPSRPKKHELPKGRSLLLAGFRQNWSTCKKIAKHYRGGLGWFLLSMIPSDAAAQAVASTSVVYLNRVVSLDPFQLGIFFEVALAGVTIGTKSGTIVTKMVRPKTSLQLAEVGLALSVVIGCWAVKDVETKWLTYFWGLSIGFFLGWYYPVSNLFFSMCLPRKQETELSGFFNCCSQIASWWPPLVFTIMLENNIQLPWALTVVAAHFVLAALILCLCDPWDKILEDCQTVTVNFYEDDNKDEANDTNDENHPTENQLLGTASA